MIYGHGGNPILFNKRINIGRPENSVTPTSLRTKTSHFCLTAPTFPSKWTSYVYHPLLDHVSENFDVMRNVSLMLKVVPFVFKTGLHALAFAGF